MCVLRQPIPIDAVSLQPKTFLLLRVVQNARSTRLVKVTPKARSANPLLAQVDNLLLAIYEPSPIVRRAFIQVQARIPLVALLIHALGVQRRLADFSVATQRDILTHAFKLEVQPRGSVWEVLLLVREDWLRSMWLKPGRLVTKPFWSWSWPLPGVLEST